MTKIIGILNYKSDSFSDFGKYSNIDDALEGINQMFEMGADIVDIGAISTAYGRKLISQEEEWEILSEILPKCASKKISVDTFYADNAKKSIDLGVGYINDVGGGKDPLMLEAIASNPSVKYIVMYSLVLPADKHTRVNNIREVYDWAERKVEQCMDFGIEKSQIIVDPGIGFVTNKQQSFDVIKNIKEYENLGVEICIGHSRKSFLSNFQDDEPKERDIETLTTSLHLYANGVDYLRVHNVSWHDRAFRIFKKLASI